MSDSQREILFLLRRSPRTRVELAEFLGISRPAVSKAVGGLLDLGILREPAGRTSPDGSVRYRKTRLSLNSEYARVAGLHLLRGRVDVALSGLDGLPSLRKAVAFDVAEPWTSVVDRALDALASLASPASPNDGSPPQWIACSTPGPVDVENGRLLSPPGLDAWHGADLCGFITRRTGIPCSLEHDAGALAILERDHGLGARFPSFGLLQVTGGGVGSAVLLEGHLFRGVSGMSPELGHMAVQANGRLCSCGSRGCLETVASGPALCRRFGEDYDRRDPGIVRYEAKHLAFGIQALANLLGLSHFVLYQDILDSTEDLVREIGRFVGIDGLYRTFRPLEVHGPMAPDPTPGHSACALAVDRFLLDLSQRK